MDLRAALIKFNFDIYIGAKIVYYYVFAVKYRTKSSGRTVWRTVKICGTKPAAKMAAYKLSNEGFTKEQIRIEAIRRAPEPITFVGKT